MMKDPLMNKKSTGENHNFLTGMMEANEQIPPAQLSNVTANKDKPEE